MKKHRNRNTRIHLGRLSFFADADVRSDIFFSADLESMNQSTVFPGRQLVALAILCIVVVKTWRKTLYQFRGFMHTGELS
jgi:hypothetical protein